MLLAFIAATSACGGAGLQDGAGEVGVVPGVPRQDAAGGFAYVGTVEVRADALGELGDHLLAETGVGAGCAGLGAVEAGFDAADKLPLVHASQASPAAMMRPLLMD